MRGLFEAACAAASREDSQRLRRIEYLLDRGKYASIFDEGLYSWMRLKAQRPADRRISRRG